MHITKIDEKYKAAGIILFKEDKILILLDQNGNYDFPKGCKDKGEKPLECALREANEECSFKIEQAEFIKNADNKARRIIYLKESKLVFYLMKSKLKDLEKHLKIKMNSKTKIYEHKEILFLTVQEIKDKIELVPEYLLPVITWIEKNYNDKKSRKKQ